MKISCKMLRNMTSDWSNWTVKQTEQSHHTCYRKRAIIWYLKNFPRWWSSFFLFSHHNHLLSFVSSVGKSAADVKFSSIIDLNAGATSSTTVEPHGQSQRLSKLLTWGTSVQLKFAPSSDMSSESMRSWVQRGNTIDQTVDISYLPSRIESTGRSVAIGWLFKFRRDTSTQAQTGEWICISSCNNWFKAPPSKLIQMIAELGRLLKNSLANCTRSWVRSGASLQWWVRKNRVSQQKII